MRQLAAAAGDGRLGPIGSPGQLETSLSLRLPVGPCNSYLEGPTPIFIWWLLAQSLLGLLLAQSRFGSAAVVVACRGKNASAHSSSVRRRAIQPTLAARRRDLPTLAASRELMLPTRRRSGLRAATLPAIA